MQGTGGLIPTRAMAGDSTQDTRNDSNFPGKCPCRGACSCCVLSLDVSPGAQILERGHLTERLAKRLIL